jgi:hypothetical protein
VTDVLKESTHRVSAAGKIAVVVIWTLDLSELENPAAAAADFHFLEEKLFRDSSFPMYLVD